LKSVISYLLNPSRLSLSTRHSPCQELLSNKPEGGRNRTEPNRTEPNRTKPNQTKPNQTKPNQTKPNQTKPNQTEPNLT